MTTIVTRAGKGSALSWDEADSNFTNLNTDKTEVSTFEAHTNATSAHGVTGDIVGTTDTQTVTNKTIDLTDNTLSGTTAEFNTALSDGDFATLAGTETLTNKTITAADNSLDSNVEDVAGLAVTAGKYLATDGSNIVIRDIVGTVSVDGGNNPNGSIFESGSNANGDYVKFADGTMICRRAIISSGAGAATFAHAATFISASYQVVGNANNSTTASDITLKGSNKTTTTVDLTSTVNGAYVSTAFDIIIIGKWK